MYHAAAPAELWAVAVLRTARYYVVVLVPPLPTVAYTTSMEESQRGTGHGVHVQQYLTTEMSESLHLS